MAEVINGVDPNDLRFTQQCISPAFKPPFQGVFLKDVIAQIKRKEMTVNTFPMLEVIRHEKTLWCLNNRRLFVFRKAKVDKIDVEISGLLMHPRLSFVLENPAIKKKMKGKNYFPYVLEYRPGQGVHTRPPPQGYPPIPPLQAGYCPSTRSIHHPGPNFNAVFGQPGQHYPCSFPMQYLHLYSVLDSMQAAWFHAQYCDPEARCILPNATSNKQLQGSAATISKPVAKVQVVQIDPARNPKVKVCAPPPPIVISPCPRSTPQCPRSQERSGPIVCVYNKLERIASPMTRTLAKPNACRDPKPVYSGQDVKGKAAFVVKEESSRLPDNHLINLEPIPHESSKYAAAGLTMSSERPRCETRMEPRLATGVGKSKPDSILQGMGNPGAPPKPPQQVPRVTDASTNLLHRQPINLGTIPKEELPDKRMNGRLGILGILITPADHRNERVVGMPPSSDRDPLLHHVPVENTPRISSMPLSYFSACWGFLNNLLK